MILADAINLVLAEYPGMKAIGAARVPMRESSDSISRLQQMTIRCRAHRA